MLAGAGTGGVAGRSTTGYGLASRRDAGARGWYGDPVGVWSLMEAKWKVYGISMKLWIPLRRSMAGNLLINATGKNS